VEAVRALEDQGSRSLEGHPRGQGGQILTFLDTSLLAELYLEGPGRDAVRRTLAVDGRKLVSDLARVEFHSAVVRRRRAGDLREAEARELLALFASKWRLYGVVTVSDSVLERASGVIDRTGLRTLDAIQLASALAAAEGDPEPLRFGSLDARLNSAAKAEGLALLL
jgi:predicted nucleic acid-binding protein